MVKSNQNSSSDKELDKVAKQFDEYSENIQSLTLDRMNAAPLQEIEQQTKISSKDMAKSTDVYLKPHRSISAPDKFNEDYRNDYNMAKEYVPFIAENKEIIGEAIDIWTRPFAGMPAEWWKVPVNKRIWGPRYLAEQIKRAKYHRLVMQESTVIGSDHMGQYTGHMIADTTVQRLDAIPAPQETSVFMGTSRF